MKLEHEGEDFGEEELHVQIWDDDWGKDDKVGFVKVNLNEFFQDEGAYIEQDFDLEHEGESAGTIKLACWIGLKKKAEEEEVDEEVMERR